MTAAPSLTPRGTTATGGKVRVLIVDDSVVIRHLLREALQIEMPQMDGLTVLRHIRKGYPRLRTVMFSTLTTRGAAATLEALSLGADDYVAKASNGGKLDESLASLRAELLPKIRQFFATAGLADGKAAPVRIPAAKRGMSQAARRDYRRFYRRPQCARQ
ncbi:MAG TPA: response regulator [Bryobacteraceae bacterium]|nr:response regulator [Bryobacteraceae bacterium]